MYGSWNLPTFLLLAHAVGEGSVRAPGLTGTRHRRLCGGLELVQAVLNVTSELVDVGQGVRVPDQAIVMCPW